MSVPTEQNSCPLLAFSFWVILLFFFFLTSTLSIFVIISGPFCYLSLTVDWLIEKCAHQESKTHHPRQGQDPGKEPPTPFPNPFFKNLWPKEDDWFGLTYPQGWGTHHSQLVWLEASRVLCSTFWELVAGSILPEDLDACCDGLTTELTGLGSEDLKSSPGLNNPSKQ